VLGPERIWANPDCGLRTRTWDVAFAKLRNLVEGARLAREAVGGGA
jgi:5-methyltetrahydropteroyltriglutamate--homocysteine methyltransferase